MIVQLLPKKYLHTSFTNVLPAGGLPATTVVIAFSALNTISVTTVPLRVSQKTVVSVNYATLCAKNMKLNSVLKKAPHVCNSCPKRITSCTLEKHLYDAVSAHKEYIDTLSESRSGLTLSEGDISHLNKIISPLLYKNSLSITSVSITRMQFLYGKNIPSIFRKGGIPS